MKTFADVKRRIQIGTAIRITAQRSLPHLDKMLGKVRHVGIVQTNAIAFTNPEFPGKRLKMAWLYWPKAADVRVTGPDSFDVSPRPGVQVSYEFADAAEAQP